MRKAKAVIVLALFAATLPAFAQGPIHGAINDSVAIGKGVVAAGKDVGRPVGAAGKHVGQNVYRAGKGIGHFCKWMVS